MGIHENIMNNYTRKQLGWPAAATLIAALVGVVSATLALTPAQPGEEPATAHRYASAREIGEVKASLAALERSTDQLRTELRSDIRELREIVLAATRNHDP